MDILNFYTLPFIIISITSLLIPYSSGTNPSTELMAVNCTECSPTSLLPMSSTVSSTSIDGTPTPPYALYTLIGFLIFLSLFHVTVMFLLLCNCFRLKRSRNRQTIAEANDGNDDVQNLTTGSQNSSDNDPVNEPTYETSIRGAIGKLNEINHAAGPQNTIALLSLKDNPAFVPIMVMDRIPEENHAISDDGKQQDDKHSSKGSCVDDSTHSTNVAGIHNVEEVFNIASSDDITEQLEQTLI